MIRTDSILKALDIDTDRYPVLSVVGGGGKTSLIFRIMEELTAVGKKVLITTTTHMAYEPDRPFAEDGDMISIKQNLEECGYTIVASLDREKRKIGALSEEKLKEIKVLADVMLIEADGANYIVVKCSNKSKGAAAKKQCEVSCIGCGICEKTCTAGAIRVTENHAVINEELCLSCGMCAVKCPRHAIYDLRGIYTEIK